MKEVPEENIRDTLSIYKPEQRVLKSASIDYLRINGTFFIGPTYYTLSSLKHATDIEIQLCLNQLAYVGPLEAVRLSIDPLLKDINFKSLQEEGMYIIESKKRFRRQMSTDKDIAADLLVKSIIKKREIILCYADFQFENNSCFGNLELAIINKKSKGDKNERTF